MLATLLLGAALPTAILTINEVDADTVSFDMLEFIELYDGGVGNTPLDGHVVVLFNGSDNQSYSSAFDLDGFSTDVNGYFLIGNPGVTPTPDLVVDPGSGGAIQNGADAVALYLGDGTDFPNDTPLTATNLIDFVAYGTNDSLDADFVPFDINGYGQPDEGANGNKDFHSVQNCPSGWNTTFPTPGAANDCSPPGDVCSTALDIGSGATVVAFDTTGNSDENNGASCGSSAMIDAWYEWTADATSTWTFSTCNDASFDTRLAVYSACGGLELGCNDDDFGGCSGFTSSLDVALLNGDTVFIQVGGFGTAFGTGNLTISGGAPPPANDDCSGATPISEGANAHDSNNATASGLLASGLPAYFDNATPDTACNDFGNGPAFADDLHRDVFYTFDAPANAGYLFSTCDTADYDTKLAIYSGSCDARIALACNDDGVGCAGFSSELRVTGLVQGQTYIVQVGGWSDSEEGTAILNVSRLEGAQTYCSSTANSTGSPATMGISGSTSIVSDDLVLECANVPADFYLFQYGTDKASFPFGNGLQCIFNPTRLDLIEMGTGGTVTRGVTQAELGNPAAGTTLFFQCFFRDGAAMRGADTSDGLAVTFGA